MRFVSDTVKAIPAFTISAAVFSTVTLSCVCSLAEAQVAPHQENQAADEKFQQLQPEDIFYQAYVKVSDGDKALEAKEYLKAWEDYSSALQYYQTLKIAHELWKPGVVEYRITETSKKLDVIRPEVQKNIDATNKAKAGIFGAERIDLNEVNAPAELIRISHKIKTEQEALEATRKHYEREVASQKKRLLQIHGDLNKFKQQNQKNPEVVAAIEKRRRAAEAALANAEAYRKTDVAKIKDTIANLNKEMLNHSDAPLKADLNRSKQQLNQTTEELRVVSIAFKKADNDRKIAEAKLAEVSTKLEASQKENQHLNDLIKQQQDISTTTVKSLHQKLKASEEREKQLAKDLNEARNLLAETAGNLDAQRAQNKILQAQLEVATTEKDRLTDLMLSNKDERVNKLLKQNLSLMNDLKDTKDKLRIVSTSQAENVDRVHEAETDLAIAKKRLLDFQDQSMRDNKRIKELKQQLLDTQKRTSNAIASGNLSPVALEENKTLRDISNKLLKRQLLTQKKLEKLREQMLAENPDPQLKALIENNLTADELQLTAREKEIIEREEQVDGVISPGNRNLSEAETRNSIARTAKQVEAIYRVAEDMMIRDRLSAAREMLEYANSIQPNSFPTLMHLGAVTMRQLDIDSAEQYFKDGLVMEQNSPYAHLMLGTCLLQKGQSDLAEKSLLHSLKLDSTQEKSHLLLALIAGESGKLEQSSDYFKAVLRLNPDVAEAYYGLSINCLLRGEIGKAQDFYHESLSKGLDPKPSHAKKLGIPH